MPRFSRYTLLNIDNSWILEEVLSVDHIPKRRKVWMPWNVNTNHNFSHTTKGCLTLKDKIKNPGRTLWRFVRQHGCHFVPHSPGWREERSHRDYDKGDTIVDYCWNDIDRPRSIQSVDTDREWKTMETPLKGVINIIVGGFAEGEASITIRKWYLCVVQSISTVESTSAKDVFVTFIDLDFQVIHPTSNYPIWLLLLK